MGRESWDKLQFLLVSKINFVPAKDSTGSKMMMLYKQWDKYEEEKAKQQEAELSKLKSKMHTTNYPKMRSKR